jgi:hypothetical protein
MPYGKRILSWRKKRREGGRKGYVPLSLFRGLVNLIVGAELRATGLG